MISWYNRGRFKSVSRRGNAWLNISSLNSKLKHFLKGINSPMKKLVKNHVKLMQQIFFKVKDLQVIKVHREVLY